MLKLNSNFVNFKNRAGELCTAEDLNLLFNALIIPDIVTFSKNKTKRLFGYGFREESTAKIVDKITVNKDSVIIVINDISLQMYYALVSTGFKPENIYLAFGKWTKDAEPSDDTTVYDIMTDYIKNNFTGVLNVIKLKEIFGMVTDLIIANPPYGKIGANITKKIIDTIDFDEYINLLPANDYKRNDSKDLFNYQSDMIPIKDGFTDAAVTTHLAKIYKTKVNNMTLDEFEISNYTDKILFKYFTENRIRKHYAIDAANLSGATDKQFKQFDINKTVTVSSRDVNHKHLPYSKTCETYRYNVLKDITNDEIFESRKATRNGIYDGWLSITGILNKTEIEKDNQVAFMYGQDGFRFLAKVFTAANADSTLNFGKVFPKVDWTRSWTVEEILADYGYTEDEIKDVMEDLKNYKGMED